MPAIITEELLTSARDFSNELTRAERASIFENRMLEQSAMNAHYANGSSIKDTVDTILANGGTPSFARKDTLGRKYAKMAVRRLRGEE